MTMIDTETPAAELREWARGLYPLEAATELLIRGGFAQAWRPWVLPREHTAGCYWIDFEALPQLIGGASGGERRFLLFAASLADAAGLAGETIGDLVAGLDRDRVVLVLAAVAHAAGSHEQTRYVGEVDGAPVLLSREEPCLYPWPA